MNGSADHSSDRRSRLLGVKLRALVAGRLGESIDAEPAGFAHGAWLIHDDAVWALADDASGRWGGALALAVRHRVASLHVISDVGAGVIARSAVGLGFPVTAWRTESARELVEAVADPVTVPVEPPREHLGFAPVITAAGAQVHIESGVVTGEVAGLEVCRVVDDAGEARLEVGVGAHDREAFAALHVDQRVEDSLARVVSAVAEHRRVGADHHPLNRLAPERLLRWRLQIDPSPIGVAELCPDEPPVPRPPLSLAAPCVASGVDADGRPVTVVCSSGVDLDLVPFVADARRAVTERVAVHHGDTPATTRRLLVVIPARDSLRIVTEMMALLDQAPGWSAPELVTLD